MERALLMTLLISLAFVSDTRASNTARPLKGCPTNEKIGKARHHGQVSQIRLIASPERYHRRFVGTNGFLSGGFLFANEIEARCNLVTNAIGIKERAEGIEVSTKDAQGSPLKFSDCDGWYVYVEGVFDKSSHDQNYSPNGTLVASRVISWMGPYLRDQAGKK